MSELIDTGSIAEQGLNITNPLARANIPVPSAVEFIDGKIQWSLGEYDFFLRGFNDGSPADGVLWEFLRLSHGSDEDITAFAREHGVLAIRSDGRPGPDPRIGGTANGFPPSIERDGKTWYLEDPRIWRAYASGMKGTIAIALALHEAVTSDPYAVLADHNISIRWEDFGLNVSEEWMPYQNVWQLNFGAGVVASNVRRVGAELARGWIARHVTNTWLDSAGLRLAMEWDDGTPFMRPVLGGSRNSMLPENALFSVLVAQMVALVISAGMERVARCSVCGELFEPLIRPGRHENAFCPRHKLEGDRARKRNWARRKAAERRAHAES